MLRKKNAGDCITRRGASCTLKLRPLQQGVKMSVSHRSNPGANGLLRLYVAGDAPGARRALENRLRIMEELAGGIEIHVVDVLAHPEEAERAGILATPTLSDESTTPPRRLIGDISNIAQVLDYFGYRKKDSGYDHS
ncbi:circadian clock KaiB family protein [Mesorhizobium sp. AD1-1]|uniref:circadian clock KaiB family protein n=1 Tax=Mesorhizobium sp. AD1-1 TaxID=2876621 RepID=UPI001CCD68A6|nr:circadian clock KaiB family protein [Mesorhizobium sp. AD1-1]